MGRNEAHCAGQESERGATKPVIQAGQHYSPFRSDSAEAHVAAASVLT